jgi:hypothetical protein
MLVGKIGLSSLKRLRQAHLSKFSIQNVESNLYEKNETTASTEIDFIQKRSKILPIGV